MTEAKTIHEAITNVMAKVGYVQKEKTAALKYSFAGEAALIAALRPEMVAEGISMYCTGIDDVVVTEYQSGSGTRMINVALTGHWAFTHAPSGTFIIVTARGEGSDSSDKANNKAMTGSFKYALRQTFMIETGDDPDKDQSDERKTSAQPTHVSPRTQTAAEQMKHMDAPKPAAPAGGWSKVQIDAAVLFEPNGIKAFANDFEFLGAVKHSKVMKPGVIPNAGLLFWIERYKEHRIVDVDQPAQAAAKADDEYLAEKARKAQDAATEPPTKKEGFV